MSASTKASLARRQSKTAKTGKFSFQTNKPKLSPPINSPVGQISFLQRTVGNREVERLLKLRVSQAELRSEPSVGGKQKLSLQTKLKVNKPGDIDEQEAERISNQVITAPTHAPG